MKQDLRQIIRAMTVPLFLIFIFYIIKILEVGMGWNFTHFGVYPMEVKGIFGIFVSPLIHSGFIHLIANTLPFFFLSWCLFFFYRNIAPYLLLIIWISSGLVVFAVGKPGWHIGASSIIYGLAFFLFFSGLFRKSTPTVAISLLVAFLYGGLIWNIFPLFTPEGISWEGHLGGAMSGMACALADMNSHPSCPSSVEEEEEEEEDEYWNDDEEEYWNEDDEAENKEAERGVAKLPQTKDIAD